LDGEVSFAGAAKANWRWVCDLSQRDHRGGKKGNAGEGLTVEIGKFVNIGHRKKPDWTLKENKKEFHIFQKGKRGARCISKKGGDT